MSFGFSVGDPGDLVAVMILAQQSFRVSEIVESGNLSRTYGRPIALLVAIFFPATPSEYTRIEKVVLHGGEEEALRFRETVTNECNMTAIAGAIIAQVALTALSLPNLSSVHWTARTALLFATVSGCLSVYYACRLQRTIGRLYQATLIRDWLRVPPPLASLKSAENNMDDKLEASLSAIFILSAPYAMMSWSILAFIVGLAIYEGFIWTKMLDQDGGQINSRNVFVAYIVGSGVCQLFFFSADLMKGIENLLRQRLYASNSIRIVVERERSHRRVEDNPESQARRPNNSANNAQPAYSGAPTASGQEPQVRGSTEGLAAALEAAATAHILSAEADRKVAAEYSKLSRLQGT